MIDMSKDILYQVETKFELERQELVFNKVIHLTSRTMYADKLKKKLLMRESLETTIKAVNAQEKSGS